MSNFKIGYSTYIPEVPTITTSASFADWKPASNLSHGSLSQYAELEAATASTRWVKYFYSTARTVDFVYLGRADLLVAQGVDTFTLSGSTDDMTYGTIYTDDISSELLTGRKRQDILYSFDTSSSYNYFWLQYAGSSSKLRHAKAITGTFFDFGDQPSDFKVLESGSQQEFEAESGSDHFQLIAEPKRRMILTFEGITDAKADEFETIIDSRYPGFILHTTGNNQVLHNERTMYVKYLYHTKERPEGVADWNRIVLYLEEYQ